MTMAMPTIVPIWLVLLGDRSLLAAISDAAHNRGPLRRRNRRPIALLSGGIIDRRALQDIIQIETPTQLPITAEAADIALPSKNPTPRPTSPPVSSPPMEGESSDYFEWVAEKLSIFGHGDDVMNLSMSMAGATNDLAVLNQIAFSKSPTTPKPTVRCNGIAGAPSSSPQESFDWATLSPSKMPSVQMLLESNDMPMELVGTSGSMPMITIDDPRSMSMRTNVGIIASGLGESHPCTPTATPSSRLPLRNSTLTPTLVKLTQSLAPLASPWSPSLAHHTIGPTMFTSLPSYPPTNSPSSERPTVNKRAKTTSPSSGPTVGTFTLSTAPNELSTETPSQNPSNHPDGLPTEIPTDEANLPMEWPTTKNPMPNPTKLPATKAPMTQGPTSPAPMEPTTKLPKLPTQTPTIMAKDVSPAPTARTPPSTGSTSRVHSSSPSASPPVSSAIIVEANSRLGLANASSTMDPRATGVLEGSCNAFLEDTWTHATTLPIYDVECKVTGQKLLPTGRSLVDSAGKTPGSTASSHGGILRASGGGLNGLKGRNLRELSLLVDVNVKGKADPAGNSTELSNVQFYYLVYGTFATQSPVFLKQLKLNGRGAGIGDFDDLSTVYLTNNNPGDEVDGDHSIEPGDGSPSPDVGSGSSDGDNQMNKGVIAVIALSAVAVLSLIATLTFCHVGRMSGEARKNGHPLSRLDVGVGEADVDALPSIHGGDPLISSSGGTSDDTFVYSLEDALARPHSDSFNETKGRRSSASLTGQMQHHTIQFANGQPFYGKNQRRVDIVVPPGKMGIIIGTCRRGPIVYGVKPTSPLEGVVVEGDLVLAVDGEDTRGWNAHELAKLVAKKNKYDSKKIIVMRADRGSDNVK